MVDTQIHKLPAVTTPTMTSKSGVSMRAVACLAGSLLAVGPVIAAEWDFRPRVELGQSYTNNVALGEDGQEESEWITELRPGLGLTVEAPRATLEADYEMQILRFDDNGDLDDVFNRASALGSIEAIPDSGFIDLFARYDQQNVDTEGRLAFSNFFTTDNRTDFAILGISPYHVGQWGNFAESLVRVTAYDVNYSNTDPGVAVAPVDSDNLEAVIAIGSPESAAGVSWDLRGSHTETDFETGDTFEFDQARFEVGVPVGARVRLLGVIGQESDALEDISQGGLDESVWFLGFRWEPSDLQSLEVRGGDRFYGSAWEASWLRRGSRGEFSVDYEENPTTSTGVLGNDDVFLPGFPPIDIGSLDTRAFLQKRLSGRASYQFARSIVAARVYSDRREFLDMMAGEEESLGFTVSYDWSGITRTTVGALLNYERRDFETGREDTYIDLTVRARRQITRVFAAELRLSRLQRDSDVSAEYDANVISLFLIARFGEDENDSR